MKKILIILFFILIGTVFGADLIYRVDILTQTRTVLGETDATNSYWTDAQLNRYIQDACNDLSVIVDIEKFDTVYSTANAWLFALNFDFREAKAVFRKVNNDPMALQQVEVDSFFKIRIKTGDTLEQYYAIFGNDTSAMTTPKIMIRPTQAVVDTYYVLYNAKANFLSGDSTITNIPQPYRTAIPYLAASLALRGASRHTEADAILQSQGIILGKPPEKTTQLLGR